MARWVPRWVTNGKGGVPKGRRVVWLDRGEGDGRAAHAALETLYRGEYAGRVLCGTRRFGVSDVVARFGRINLDDPNDGGVWGFDAIACRHCRKLLAPVIDDPMLNIAARVIRGR